MYQLNPLIKVYATTGVVELCEENGCFWLFTDMALVYQELKDEEPFLSVKATGKDNKAEVIYEDGNYNVLRNYKYDYSDLEGEHKFFITDDVIMLPSEY